MNVPATARLTAVAAPRALGLENHSTGRCAWPCRLELVKGIKPAI